MEEGRQVTVPCEDPDGRSVRTRESVVKRARFTAETKRPVQKDR
jgi:hypothetical protein